MKKVWLSLFSILCIGLCLIPSLLTFVIPCGETIGNEQETALPSLFSEDKSFNVAFLTQLGEYFEKHFALRKEAITADALVQSEVFRVSNVDSVTVGSDGWLYYTSTVDDCLGKNTLSDRQVSAVVHNLKMIEDYSKRRGAEFLFTSPPNKNTLYPEHMPYYLSVKTSDIHNRDLLNAALAKSEVNYYNLYDLFKDQDETLYLKRDSHWNNKGALLAYNGILDHLGKSHDDFSSEGSIRRKDFKGDLSRMLYPALHDTEYNDYYDTEGRYSYNEGFQSVEDNLITTTCADAASTLYMYRDSFSNALVPFFASAFEKATFSKGFAVDLDKTFSETQTDVYIIELVERNIDWLITMPPFFATAQLTYYQPSEIKSADITFAAEDCVYSSAYKILTAALPEEVDPSSSLYISTENEDGSKKAYEAFLITDDSGALTAQAYVKAEDFSDSAVNGYSLLTETDHRYTEYVSLDRSS